MGGAQAAGISSSLAVIIDCITMVDNTEWFYGAMSDILKMSFV